VRYYVVRPRGVPRKPWWPKDTPKRLQVRPVGNGRWEVCKSGIPEGWLERYQEAYDAFFSAHSFAKGVPYFTVKGLEKSGYRMEKEP
jgi:hypothetical protein